MGLLRGIFELFFPPRHEFTPVPDDYPPEGSMHFLPCEDHFPLSPFELYQFSSNWGEDDENVVRLGLIIMDRLCASHPVLTRLWSTRELSKKEKQKNPMRFLPRYQRLLQEASPEVSTYAKDEKTLFILGRGFDRMTLAADRNLSTEQPYYPDFFVFPDNLELPDAKAAAGSMERTQYDLSLVLSDLGPKELLITLNPQRVDAKAVEALIQAVCEENGILFQNPPGADEQ